MLSVKSLQLFSTASISANLNQKSHAKAERRLKELSQLLGISSKHGWPSTNSEQSTSKASIIFPQGSTTEKITAIHWNESYKAFLLFLSNGILVWCLLDPVDLNSISNIHFDRYLVGKIKTDHIVDCLFESKRILITYTSSKLTYILLDDKKSRVFQAKPSKSFKLKTKGVKILEYELDAKSSLRRVERHLLLSKNKVDDELLIVWWQNGSTKLCPWTSPSSSTKEFCNIMIYNVLRDSLDLVGFASITNDILKMEFCQMRPDTLMTVESDSHAHSSLYREYQIILQGDAYVMEMIESVRINIPAKCLRADINNLLGKVLLLCANRTVVMYSIDQNTISYFQAPIEAIDLANSPLDSYFIVSDSCGQIMMYDYSLHLMSANYDDLFLKEAFCGLDAMKFLGNNFLCLKFADDPNLTFIALPYNLDFTTLIRTYLKNDFTNEAVENLRQLNWNQNSFLAHATLNIIFNHLITQPLNSVIESHLQATLATFYIPKMPINEDVVSEYQYEMHCLAKRFFFHLLHYMCLEKAFLLALDLKSRHLFILLYKIAKERGNRKLADVSLRYAQRFSLVDGKQKTPINLEILTQNENGNSEVSVEAVTDQNREAFELNNNLEDYPNLNYLSQPASPQVIIVNEYAETDPQMISDATSQLKRMSISHQLESRPIDQTSNTILLTLSGSEGNPDDCKYYLQSPDSLNVASLKQPETEDRLPIISQRHAKTPAEYSSPSKLPPPIPPKSYQVRSTPTLPSFSAINEVRPTSSKIRSDSFPDYEPPATSDSTSLRSSKESETGQSIELQNKPEPKMPESAHSPNTTLLEHLLDDNYLSENRQFKCVHLGLV